MKPTMMKKYQVIKFEEEYVGIYFFDDLEPAKEMFEIFKEEAIKEVKRDAIITLKICLTQYGKVIESWFR